MGQEQVQAAPAGAKLETLWGDLLHFIKVGRAVAAQSYGRAILESNADPAEVYLLSVKTPDSMAILAKGARLEGMSEIVEKLSQMISKGYESQRSDPAQIANAIDMLAGTLRAYKEGKQRLVTSGEYALPQMLQKLRDPRTPVSLKYKIATVLPEMGRDAVRPLTVALQTKNPELLDFLVGALEKIQYPHAAARLKQLLARDDLADQTRQAARRALLVCSGGDASVFDKTVAEVFYETALRYYYKAESILPDQRYDTANVWYWDDSVGLTYKPVPRPIFCDVYAMRMSKLALQSDPRFYPSVSLWLAAYLRKQSELPAGTVDPTQPQDMPSARFFALASPAAYLQDVLARALKDHDTAVALGAIEALAKTAGAKSLVQPVEGGVTPLVRAMSYPDRQVRYLAALSLANALPTSRFEGYQLVMSVFQEALRQSGAQTVLLVCDDETLSNRLKPVIRNAGYRVIDAKDALAAVEAARAELGVDLAVLTSSPDPRSVLQQLRSEPLFSALPVLIVSSTSKARSVAESDSRAMAVEPDLDEEALAAALSDAIQLGVGGKMTGQQASQWIERVTESIRLLGLTNNPVFDVKLVSPALIEILKNRHERMLSAVRALAVIPTPQAQSAIAEFANSADLEESVRIEAYKALSESGRRFGNMLSDEQSAGVLDVVKNAGSAQLKEAAAQALGVLSLLSEQIKSLILQSS